MKKNIRYPLKSLFSVMLLMVVTSLSATTVEYSYDTFGRVIAAQYANGKVTYTYDAAGNILKIAVIDFSSLTTSINPIIKVGELETISWNGTNIDNGEMLNIQLYRNNNWESIATEIAYSSHTLNWLVNGTAADNAKIRISLVSNSNIFIESTVNILAKTNPNDSDNDGMPNQWELDHGLDPNDPKDALLDADKDGINNLTEYLNNTNPNSPEHIQEISVKGGFIKLDTLFGALPPDSSDCSIPEKHYGRLVLNVVHEAKSILYLCTASGWKQLNQK